MYGIRAVMYGVWAVVWGFRAVMRGIRAVARGFRAVMHGIEFSGGSPLFSGGFKADHPIYPKEKATPDWLWNGWKLAIKMLEKCLDLRLSHLVGFRNEDGCLPSDSIHFLLLWRAVVLEPLLHLF